MTEIKCLTIDELKSALKDMGEKPFRAGQIFKWLHEGVQSFDEMSNLSKELRARLAENFILTVPEVARKQVSRVDGTVKYLWRMRDGDCVESVLMHYEHGVSVCVSTQVGCRMGCKFCASGLNGKKRNLSAGEILDEILRTLIRKNVGIELNTGGYHYGLGEPNPCVNIIRRYRELGGEIITIGADAHTPDKIGYAFDKAADVLRECGFSYYAVFKNRRPVFHKL